VRRVCALVLSVSVFTTAAQMAWLHTHAAEGYDHPEHQHGPAAHSHTALPAHHDEADETAVEACDPGDHVVSAAVAWASASMDAGVAAGPPAVSAWVPPIGIDGERWLTDTRVHGPPAGAPIPPRAPPPSLI
jgi:hypothetical protein